MNHADEHLEGSRLASSIATEQAVDGALGDPQVEIIDNPAVAVAFGQSMRENSFGHGDAF
jgi:hypothetical protein